MCSYWLRTWRPHICIRICIHNQTNTLRFCREDNPLYVLTLWRNAKAFLKRKNTPLYAPRRRLCQPFYLATNCKVDSLLFVHLTYMSNTVESTLFVRMEWIRNLMRISDSTAFVSMLSNLLRIQSYEWSRFVT